MKTVISTSLSPASLSGEQPKVSIKVSPDRSKVEVKIPAAPAAKLRNLADYLSDNYDGNSRYVVKDSQLTISGKSPEDTYGKGTKEKLLPVIAEFFGSTSASGADLGDLLDEEQEFANDVTKLLSKLRVLASKDDYMVTVSKKEIRQVLFAVPKQPTFDYEAWFSKNICPIGKTARIGSVTVAVEQSTKRGQTAILVKYKPSTVEW